jgi:hypothetical protein
MGHNVPNLDWKKKKKKKKTEKEKKATDQFMNIISTSTDYEYIKFVKVSRCLHVCNCWQLNNISHNVSMFSTNGSVNV